jgi:ABC-type oligopeptide transport system substrate-binding subunit
MQTRKVILSIAVILMLSVLTQPIYAWVYHNNPVDDGLYERFGTHADRLLISLYADDTAEFDALAVGDIDLTDWPLSKTRYDQFTGPLNATIQVVSYGPEYGLFILDINSNNNQYLGNPPDPASPNPVYEDGTDGDGNPTSNVGLRRAIAYLCNRDVYLADPSIGAGFGYPMYTAMPPAQLKYLLDVTEEPYYSAMPWSSTYSREAANATLDAWGFAEIDPVTHCRIWNVTGDLVNLKFYIRSDHPGRNMIGTLLLAELTAVGLKYTAYFGNSPFCQIGVMANKDFHLYTAGWSLGVNPDHLILWAWAYYWHPGKPYNYSGHNDPEFNEAADGIMYANNQEEAVAMAITAQYRQALMVLSVPLYCVAGNKAYHKTYVGSEPGEEGYTGKNWRGVKNMLGYGIDNGWSLMNMWPEQTEVMGNGAMTIRWGFKTPEIMEWNPIYSQWLFDWNAMNPLYEALLTRNPNDMGELIPDLAKNWTVSSYMNPNLGVECTKIRFQLRECATWSDGEKISIGDIYFTFKELPDILASRGLPPPWWMSNIQDILSFSIIDPCTFEVLLGVKSYWALSWIGTNIILPQHIWRTIAETGDPQATEFDLLRLTGNGPWKAGSYGGVGSTVLHYRNPLFFNSVPVDTSVFAQGDIISPQKIKPCTPPANAWFEVTTTSNWYLGDLIVDKYIYFTNETLPATETLVIVDLGITLEYGVPDVETVTLAQIAAALNKTLPSWPICHYDIDVRVHIVGPPTVGELPIYGPLPNPWICTWKNCSFDWWGTLKTDICGQLEYEPGVPMPDCIVDMRDINRAARAFGAAVGDSRWDSAADINGDAIIDMRDLGAIARDFGKP